MFPKDLRGLLFGRLTAIETIGKNKHGDAIWKCLCCCGKEVIATRNHLIRGNTKSCGCLNDDTRSEMCIKRNTTHNMSRSPEFNSWVLMHRRCRNDKDNNPDFDNYAGRGITVDPSWYTFEQFYKDMGDKPGRGYSIERINNEGGYTPENCKWATQKEQCNNTRNTRKFCIKGEVLSQQNLAKKFGINVHTLKSKMYFRNLSVLEALREFGITLAEGEAYEV